MRQTREPLAEEPVNLFGGPTLGEALGPRDVAAGEQTIVERFKGEAALGQLPFEILMAIETKLGRVGKVRAELQEERAEVGVQAVEIIDVTHRRGIADPRNGAAAAQVLADRAGHAQLLLRHADEDHALLVLEVTEARWHHVIFALAFLKTDQFELLPLEEVADLGDETSGHFAGIFGGGEAVAEITAQEPGHARLAGELGDISVQIQAVHAFEFQDDVILLELGDGRWQVHGGVGWAFVPSVLPEHQPLVG